MDKTTMIILDLDLKAEIDADAKQHGMNRSEWIRAAARTALDQPVTHREAAALLRNEKPLKMHNANRQRIHGDLIARYGGAFCQGCGRDFTFDPRILIIDHIRPKADGGGDDFNNLTLLCDPCNRVKLDKLTLSGLQDKNRKDGNLCEQNLRLGKYASYSSEPNEDYQEYIETKNIYLKARERIFYGREWAGPDDLVEFIRRQWNTPDDQMESVLDGCLEMMEIEVFYPGDPNNSQPMLRRA